MPKSHKYTLLETDPNICAYCRVPLNELTATVDHIIPKNDLKSELTRMFPHISKTSLGRIANNLDNLILSCETCNKVKGNTVAKLKFIPPPRFYESGVIYHYLRKGFIAKDFEVAWKNLKSIHSLSTGDILKLSDDERYIVNYLKGYFPVIFLQEAWNPKDIGYFPHLVSSWSKVETRDLFNSLSENDYAYTTYIPGKHPGIAKASFKQLAKLPNFFSNVLTLEEKHLIQVFNEPWGRSYSDLGSGARKTFKNKLLTGKLSIPNMVLERLNNLLKDNEAVESEVVEYEVVESEAEGESAKALGTAEDVAEVELTKALGTAEEPTVEVLQSFSELPVPATEEVWEVGDFPYLEDDDEEYEPEECYLVLSEDDFPDCDDDPMDAEEYVTLYTEDYPQPVKGSFGVPGESS